MFKIKHRGKWLNVEGVDKCDEAVIYRVRGKRKGVRSEEVEDVDLSEKGREVLNPDGSITRGPGKEPLRKPIAKSLKERWKLLKAKLNNKDSILTLVGNEKDGEDQPGADGEQPQNDGNAVADNSEEEDQVPKEGEGVSDADGSSTSVGDELNESTQDAGNDEMKDQSQGVEPEGEEPKDSESNPEELSEYLKEQGYSPSEVAYVVEGHSPVPMTDEQMGADKHKRDMGQREDEHGLDLNYKKLNHEVQHAHNKRSLDLEHEMARREKELKLKYLEQELQAKVENLKAKAKEQ